MAKAVGFLCDLVLEVLFCKKNKTKKFKKNKNFFDKTFDKCFFAHYNNKGQRKSNMFIQRVFYKKL